MDGRAVRCGGVVQVAGPVAHLQPEPDARATLSHRQQYGQAPVRLGCHGGHRQGRPRLPHPAPRRARRWSQMAIRSRGQLRHLREMAARPNITIQVLPFSAGASTGMYGPYVVLEFPQPGLGKVVFLENLTGGLYLETEEEVGRYTLAFDHLRASALPTEESMKLISAVAGEL
ncbi:Scr1 family TA system antitoxin-like transcriptional regulator [Sphaerisporangium sp. NPDC049002]|uniref:Scr1 family TA system antitoxin-like transcriptional regulator n=1 Tax=Sphaerisporangium sp. NPDC049002 TaxID=3155392 RepID=UPI0033FC25A0